MKTKKRKCGIPARTLPPCDLEYGHEGDMHANAGDGFYARDWNAEHHARQRAKAAPAQKTVLGRVTSRLVDDVDDWLQAHDGQRVEVVLRIV